MLYETQRDKLTKELIDQKMITQQKSDDYANLSGQIATKDLTIDQQAANIKKYENIVGWIPNEKEKIFKLEENNLKLMRDEFVSQGFDPNMTENIILKYGQCLKDDIGNSFDLSNKLI